MAWRLHDRIVRGEIENRDRGRVRGKLWLIGRDDAVTLDLIGNCWRDLAGCVLKFENPRPVAAKKEDPDLNAQQEGVVGDITASRKVRVFDVPVEEALRIGREGGMPPEHMANSVYIEWFSEANGRVVIESADYRIDVSPPAWTLTPEQEQQQAETNRQAMLDWMHRLGDTVAEPGHAAAMTSDKDNVHWFVARSPHAVTFDVIVDGLDPGQDRYVIQPVDPLGGQRLSDSTIRAPLLSFEESSKRYTAAL
jgi:hypothetical protein